MALLSGLGVTAAMGYASFRMVMSDFHYGLYFASGGRVPSRLEAALAWQPQNPGPHFLAAKAQLEHLLLIHRALLSIAPRPDTAGTGTPSKANSTVGSEENLALISRLLKKVQIQDTLDNLDLMSRNGMDVLVVHALKALTAEMVSNRSLALSFIEQARRNGYSDSPFLGAYYLHLSRLLGRDEVETRERLALVFRYQPEAFRAWQVYFDDPLAVEDKQLERYRGLEGNLGFFHYFYRKIREK